MRGFAMVQPLAALQLPRGLQGLGMAPHCFATPVGRAGDVAGGGHKWLRSGASSCCFATPMGRMRAAGMGNVGAAARRNPPRAPHPRLLSRLCTLGSS